MGALDAIRVNYVDDVEEQAARKRAFVEDLKTRNIAEQTAAANEQHYEVPTEYYDICLGTRKKYSSCYWPKGVTTLEEAEDEAFRRTCDNAGVKDGMKVLDLGCGWGSLTLWLAEHYPSCTIHSVSNSQTQKEYIDGQCKAKGFGNVTVFTADINDFEAPGGYDRVMSIEMFEHMKNYEKLMGKVADWLVPGGALFVHIFVHKEAQFHFVDTGSASTWMSRHFFSGGTMPSDDLLHFFTDRLALKKQWRWNGEHYAKTLNAWLERVDANPAAAKAALAKAYGTDNITKYFVYHRLFFIASAELFAIRGGNEFYVSHYLFEKPHM
jgi:cyclopropane-fatty-acyl-phospholipid synthase